MESEHSSVDHFAKLPQPEHTILFKQWTEEGAYFMAWRGTEAYDAKTPNASSGTDAVIIRGYYPPTEKYGNAVWNLHGQEPEERVLHEAVRRMVYIFKKSEAGPDGN